MTESIASWNSPTVRPELAVAGGEHSIVLYREGELLDPQQIEGCLELGAALLLLLRRLSLDRA